MMKYAIATARQLVDVHGQEIIQIEELYAEYLAQFGFQLFVLPLLSDIQTIYHMHPEMVLLPGGGDVPAEYYDSSVDVIAQCNRDLMEKKLISFAIDNNIPLLGICRGMQMINGFLGGKLTRCLEQSYSVASNHYIQICNSESICEVNSFHRDVIQLNSLSEELEAIAFHENYKHIEAFVGIKHPILGLQWHPERMDKNTPCREYSDKLITKLIDRRGVM